MKRKFIFLSLLTFFTFLNFSLSFNAHSYGIDGSEAGERPSTKHFVSAHYGQVVGDLDNYFNGGLGVRYSYTFDSSGKILSNIKKYLCFNDINASAKIFYAKNGIRKLSTATINGGLVWNLWRAFAIDFFFDYGAGIIKSERRNLKSEHASQQLEAGFSFLGSEIHKYYPKVYLSYSMMTDKGNNPANINLGLGYNW